MISKYKRIFQEKLKPDDVPVIETPWRSIYKTQTPYGEWDYIENKPGVGVLPYRHEGQGRGLSFLIRLEYNPLYPGNQAITIVTGRKDEGESDEDCAARELQEETGYYCDNLGYLGELRLGKGALCNDKIFACSLTDAVQGPITTDGSQEEKLSKNIWVPHLKFITDYLPKSDCAYLHTAFSLLLARLFRGEDIPN